MIAPALASHSPHRTRLPSAAPLGRCCFSFAVPSLSMCSSHGFGGTIVSSLCPAPPLLQPRLHTCSRMWSHFVCRVCASPLFSHAPPPLLLPPNALSRVSPPLPMLHRRHENLLVPLLRAPISWPPLSRSIPPRVRHSARIPPLPFGPLHFPSAPAVFFCCCATPRRHSLPRLCAFVSLRPRICRRFRSVVDPIPFFRVGPHTNRCFLSLSLVWPCSLVAFCC